MNNLFLSVVVPVYREESNIIPFLKRMESTVNKLELNYEIIFCMDPSPDNTEQIIRDEIKRNNNIKLIKFSRKFGQPAATMAGIHVCRGDICVIIDVDLQDPPELIEEMISKYKEGYNVVYAKRSSRKGETIIKKVLSYYGYRFINKIAEIDIPRDTGDFRLIDRKIIEELKKLKESHAFLRGLVAFVGFKQTYVEYDRDERASGQTNYNKYIGSSKIILNGIVCFSVKPLQIASIVGGVIAFLGFTFGVFLLIQKYILHIDVTPGLTSTTILITFLAGIQLLFLGIIGEYIGRIYEEVKNRPLYIIEETHNL